MEENGAQCLLANRLETCGESLGEHERTLPVRDFTNSFLVSTIVIDPGAKFAIVNGKTMSEGQVFRLHRGNQTYQITVKSIQDGEDHPAPARDAAYRSLRRGSNSRTRYRITRHKFGNAGVTAELMALHEAAVRPIEFGSREQTGLHATPPAPGPRRRPPPLSRAACQDKQDKQEKSKCDQRIETPDAGLSDQACCFFRRGALSTLHE